MSLYSIAVLSCILAVPVGMALVQLIFEPRRKRRVLWTLYNQTWWLFGRDVARQAEVRFVHITLAALEEEGLVERQIFEPSEDAPAAGGFLPNTRYRLTPKGRRVESERISVARSLP